MTVGTQPKKFAARCISGATVRHWWSGGCDAVGCRLSSWLMTVARRSYGGSAASVHEQRLLAPIQLEEISVEEWDHLAWLHAGGADLGSPCWDLSVVHFSGAVLCHASS